MFEKFFKPKFSFYCLIGFLSFLFFPLLARADFEGNSGLAETGAETGHTNLNIGGLEGLVGNIIQTVLSFVGILFLLLMIYGGYTWMTAAGNEEKVSKGRKLITQAIIGLIVVLAAYAITWFVMSQFASRALS